MTIDRLKKYSAVMVMVTLAGCASTAQISVTRDFPTVLAEPRDISATLVVDQDFKTYKANPNDKTFIDIGNAQVNLLSKAFRGLFSQVEVVSTREQADADSDLVIIPSVREVQVSTPSESYLNVYEVWIKYNLDIETRDGEPIDSWFMPAYGKTPNSAMLSRTKAIEEATVIALRDAGAKLLLDFYRIPAIYGWLQQHQDTEVNK